MPVGTAGICGVMDWTVVADNQVPPLTPVNLFHNLRTVVDLDELTMTYKTFGATTTLERLPSGHVCHSLMEFPKEGWDCPGPEVYKGNTDFEAKSKKFRPTEFPRESADSIDGFVQAETQYHYCSHCCSRNRGPTPPSYSRPSFSRTLNEVVQRREREDRSPHVVAIKSSKSEMVERILASGNSPKQSCAGTPCHKAQPVAPVQVETVHPVDSRYRSKGLFGRIVRLVTGALVASTTGVLLSRPGISDQSRQPMEPTDGLRFFQGRLWSSDQFSPDGGWRNLTSEQSEGWQEGLTNSSTTGEQPTRPDDPWVTRSAAAYPQDLNKALLYTLLLAQEAKKDMDLSLDFYCTKQ